MDLTVERVEVWAAMIDDKPGSLAKTLTGLREAGADRAHPAVGGGPTGCLLLMQHRL